VSTRETQLQAPKRRARFSGELPLPMSGEVPYAKCRPELKDLTAARIAKLVVESDPWKEKMAPQLEAIDKAREIFGKEKAVYSAHLLESLFVYQRVCGLRSYRETRDRLASDKGAEARELLGLNGVRRYRNKSGKRVIRLMEGIPSEPTMTRHRKRMPESKLAAVYEEAVRSIVAKHLEDPQMRRELLTVNMDGTALLTHYTCPIYDKDTGALVNDESITCHDGGYVPYDIGPTKSGHGWNLISITTSTGLPLVHRLVPLNASEKDTGLELLGDWERDIVPHLGEPSKRPLTVLSADGGFNKPLLRAKARELGILENIHTASHGDSATSKSNVKAKDNKRIPFDDPDYKNWFANGHREVFCACGTRAKKRIRLNESGEVISRVEGRCDKCGSITITSGQWRRAQNPDRFTRCLPRTADSKRDWLLGNGLTFHSPEAREYGSRRFGHNEGFHGALVSRFQLTKGKRWFRRRDQARIDTALTFLIMHVVALEQRKRAREAEALGPPLKLAA
jgi:hypothetical protein